MSKSVVAVANGGNALSAQHGTTGITPAALMLRQQAFLYAARRSSRAETPPQCVCSSGYGVGQGPDPAVSSTKPETVPLNSDDAVIVPVVLTTTTNCPPAGTVNE